MPYLPTHHWVFLGKKSLEEAIEKVESDERFKKLREMLEKNPNYALPFVKFIYDQGGSIDDIRSTFNQIINPENKGLIPSLPKTIDEYSKIKGESKPGYEILIDDLLVLKEKGKMDKFYKSLEKTAKAAQKLYDEGARSSKPVNVKWIDDLRKISPELKQKLVYAVNSIYSKKGDKGIHQLSQAAMTYMTGKYGKSIEDYVNYAADIAEAQGADIYDVAEIVDKEGSAAASIIYMGENWLIVAIRSPKAQTTICARAFRFCINNGLFWSYAKGRIQYGIFNFNRKETDPLSFIGTTVLYNGDIYSDDFRNQINEPVIRGKTLKENLEYQGVPPEGIEETLKSIKNESRIRKLTDDIFQNNIEALEQRGWRGFLDEVNSQSNRASTGIGSTEEEYKLLFQISIEILKNQFKNDITPKNVIDFYRKTGIYSQFGMEAFKTLSNGEYTTDDVSKIKKAATDLMYKEGPLTLEAMSKLAEKRPKVLENSRLKALKYVVDNSGSIEKILDQL